MSQEDLARSFTNYLRKATRSRSQSPVRPAERYKKHQLDSDEPIRTHLRESQSSYAHGNGNPHVQDTKHPHRWPPRKFQLRPHQKKKKREPISDTDLISEVKGI